MTFAFKVWDQANDGQTMALRVNDVDELARLAEVCTGWGRRGKLAEPRCLPNTCRSGRHRASPIRSKRRRSLAEFPDRAALRLLPRQAIPGDVHRQAASGRWLRKPGLLRCGARLECCASATPPRSTHSRVAPRGASGPDRRTPITSRSNICQTNWAEQDDFGRSRPTREDAESPVSAGTSRHRPVRGEGDKSGS